jgi:hypothetical protein
MVLRVTKAFGTSPEPWLRLQVVRDLWDARRTRSRAVARTRARRTVNDGAHQGVGAEPSGSEVSLLPASLGDANPVLGRCAT